MNKVKNISCTVLFTNKFYLLKQNTKLNLKRKIHILQKKELSLVLYLEQLTRIFVLKFQFQQLKDEKN